MNRILKIQRFMMVGMTVVAAALWMAPVSWGKGIVETPVPTPAPVAQATKSPESVNPLKAKQDAEQRKKQEAEAALARQQKMEEDQRQKKQQNLRLITGDDALADVLSRSSLKEEDIKKLLEKYDFSKNLKAEEMMAVRKEGQFVNEMETSFGISAVAKEGEYELSDVTKGPGGVTGYLVSKAAKRADRLTLKITATQKNGMKATLKCAPIDNFEPGERRMVRLPKTDQEIDPSTVKLSECSVLSKPKM